MKNKQAEILLGIFVTEYERWEDSQTRRLAYSPPNYEKLGHKMFEAYKTAKEYGY
jgi:hypothetical protein